MAKIGTVPSLEGLPSMPRLRSPEPGDCPYFGGDRVVAAARSCVGTRFRAQGRAPGIGLDCVGLVAFATGVEAPVGYGLRGSVERVDGELTKLGFARVEKAQPGDVIVMRVGAGRAHLGVWTGAGVVHADARLRRVVETPGEPWPVVGAWRSPVFPRSDESMDAETSSA